MAELVHLETDGAVGVIRLAQVRGSDGGYGVSVLAR